jgi:hypothetical protein
MRILQEKPLIGLLGEGLDDLRTAQINRIAFGTGVIAVDASRSRLTDLQTKVAFLSSVGRPDKEISTLLRGGKQCAQNAHIAIGAKLEIRSRSGIAYRLFEEGVYVVEQKGQPLELWPTQAAIIGYVAHDQTNAEIGEPYGIHKRSVSDRLEPIANASGWRKREQIALAAMLSGEVGPFATQAAERTQAAINLQPQPPLDTI